MEADSYKFELSMALNCMCQDDACGNIYVANYDEDGVLQFKVLEDWEQMSVEDFKDYDLVLVDGGNTAGDSWKHMFYPRRELDFFIDENPIA